MDSLETFTFISAFLSTLFTTSCTSSDIGYFWHVTDFHFDSSYNKTDLSCNGNVTRHGQYGDYWCDSPWKLAQSSVQEMHNINPNVDFILWTGDNVPHVEDENLSVDINDRILGNLTDLLKSFFTVPVYATYGNHDYFPNGQFPAHGNDLYNRTLEMWVDWINDTEQHDNFRKGGYYTVVTSEGLRIIALNTNLYYTSDKLTKPTSALQDPSDQFLWLENVLINATNANENVLITGHVPPGITYPNGKPWFYNQYNIRMNKLLRKYSAIIKGLHFGHEHGDNFRIYYKSGIPVLTLFCAPSVTPWKFKIPGLIGPSHNPSFRLVQYDTRTGQQLNYIQYYMDLPASNTADSPQWKVEYNATQDYQLDDFSPVSFHKLVDRMKGENSAEFQNHYKWRDVSVAPSIRDPCSPQCKMKIICQLKNVDQESYDSCIKDQIGHATAVKANIFLFITMLFGVLILTKVS